MIPNPNPAPAKINRRAIALAVISLATISGQPVSANDQVARYEFRDFPATSVHTGRTTLPDFSGRDRKFRQYRTRIRESMKDGPNFAGEFSLIQIGCGTGCSIAFIASNSSGEVYQLPRGGEKNLFMQFSKMVESRLLILQWGSYREDSCLVEYFEWKDRQARELQSIPVGNAETCFNTIDETLAKLK